eukprot:5999140-Amphidinium_carterae.2
MASMTIAVGKRSERGHLTRCGLPSERESIVLMLLQQEVHPRQQARTGAKLRLRKVPTGEPNSRSVALVGKLSEADAEKFWKWEPGFGYQSDGRITGSQQSVSSKPQLPHHLWR